MSDRAREKLALLIGDVLTSGWAEESERVLTGMREQGLIVIDTRDEATVERMAAELYEFLYGGSWDGMRIPHHAEMYRMAVRAVLAALAKGGE